MSLREELKRKGIHLCSAAGPLAYALWLTRVQAAVIFGVLTAGILIVEALRHGDHAFGRLFRRLFDSMLREREKTARLKEGARPSFMGTTPYLIASLVCVAIFPKPTAVMALLYLAVGDTAASLVGRTWGKMKIGEKSIEGAIAFFVSCAAVAWAAAAISPEYRFVPALVGALAGAAAELFVPRLDDNFTVPLSAGGAMTVALWLAG